MTMKISWKYWSIHKGVFFLEKPAEQQATDAEIIRDFYNVVISDMKQQISNLSEERAIQFALNEQNQKKIHVLTEQLKSMEQKLINSKQESDKK